MIKLIITYHEMETTVVSFTVSLPFSSGRLTDKLKNFELWHRCLFEGSGLIKKVIFRREALYETICSAFVI